MSVRILRATSPEMHGSDVTHLQRALNGWLARWHVNLHLRADGVYGPQTREALKLVCYGLGIDWRDGATPTLRRKIREPARRTNWEKKVSAGRADWRRRLKHRFDTGNAVELFVAYLKAHVGVTEHPAGSNQGPQVDIWNRLVGTPPGPAAYWCGALQNAALVAAGFPTEHFMAYVPYIEGHAKAGQGGWRWHSASSPPKKGWIATFGSPIGEHTEGAIEDGWPLRTIGGNTSKGDGSPNNGGVVAYHDFSHYRGLPLRGFAEPPFGRIG